MLSDRRMNAARGDAATPESSTARPPATSLTVSVRPSSRVRRRTASRATGTPSLPGSRRAL